MTIGWVEVKHGSWTWSYQTNDGLQGMVRAVGKDWKTKLNRNERQHDKPYWAYWGHPYNFQGEAKYMENLLHVLNIAKTLVFIGQIVEQGLGSIFFWLKRKVDDKRKKRRMNVNSRGWCIEDVEPKVHTKPFVNRYRTITQMDRPH